MAHKSRPQQDKSAAQLERGLELQRANDHQGALACYSRIPDHHPARADALHLSGIIRSQQGNPAEGAALIAQAIKLRPASPIYYVNLANAQEELGDIAAAEMSLRNALSIDTQCGPALFNLGNLLAKHQRDDEAMGLLDRALVADPNHLNACLALGSLLLRKQQPELASRLADRAQRLAPTSKAVSDLLIGCHVASKRYHQALAEFTERLKNDPGNVALIIGEAFCLEKLGLYSDALAVFKIALAIKPDDHDAAIRIAMLYTTMGDPEASLDCLSRLLETATDRAVTYSNWLFQLNYFDSLGQVEVLEKHRNWEQQVKLSHAPFSHPVADCSARRLRIAYISEDFKRHSVASFIEDVLGGHDRQRFEVFAYFVKPEHDETTARIRSKVDVFRDLPKATPEQIAQRIHEDRIDIAIELAGHTSIYILEAMLYRPAPVQISWLGYPNSTGCSTIDYRISDCIADPPGLGDGWNSEQMIRLPDCFHCYRPERKVSFDPTPPFERTGFVTFGSFNVLPKLSAACCEAWARIVAAVPGAKLLLKNRSLNDEVVRERLLQRFEAAGLPAERIIFSGDKPDWADHMAVYREVDIGLDPFPYNGTTTTCEALWMGVPVITAMGDRHASRVGASLLTAIGHPELICPDRESYVTEAIRLAKDPQRISAFHARIHDDFANSPICDAPCFLHHLEAAYEDVWKHHCARQE